MDLRLGCARAGNALSSLPVPPASSKATSGPFSARLLERARDGHRGACRELLLAHQQRVHAFIWRMLGPLSNAETAADLTQDTFLKVFRALARFDEEGGASLSTWILTIATRTTLNHLRSSRATAAETELLDVPCGETPEQTLSRQRLGAELSRVIGGLPDDFRGAFLLREYHGLSYQEIAEALGVEVGTVRSRLSRARALLRSALGEELLHG
jgi:RNA polymerase sigma-70 factor, ECF subfamily